MKNDITNILEPQKPVIYSRYQNLTMSSSVARNRTLKCKKAPSNVRKRPFNIKSKNSILDSDKHNQFHAKVS